MWDLCETPPDPDPTPDGVQGDDGDDPYNLFPDDSTVFTELPDPTPAMTASKKGRLLEEYVKAGKAVAGRPFWDADVQGADLSRAILIAGDFRGALFDQCLLVAAHLERADFSGAYLRQAKMREAHLSEADLRRARLQGADLSSADLSNANLEEAQLRDVRLDGADLFGAAIDHLTYLHSGWTPEDLVRLYEQGVRINALTEFPPDAQAAVLNRREGLTLHVSRRLTPFDRFLVEGVLFSTLGRGTDCRLVEYREQGDTAIIRLEGSRCEDLEAVAEALYHRVWELQERAQRATLAQLAQALAPQTVNVNAPVGTQIIVQNATFGLHADLAPVVTRLQKLQDALGASLSDLVDRLEKMELRLPSEEAAADQTAAATARRELKLVRTWDPGTHPRTALDRLLAMLEPDELRLLLARGPEGAEVVALVPSGTVAPLVLASQAADELVRRGLVDEGFFARVVAEQPDLEEQVRRVAGMWQWQGQEQITGLASGLGASGGLEGWPRGTMR